MKKTFIRLLSLALCIVMMAAMFISCAKEEEESDSKKGNGTDKGVKSVLGFEEQDYEGKQFNVLVNNSYDLTERDFYIADPGADNLSKVIYERNVACEDYLGITLNYIREPGAYDSGLPNKIKIQVDAGACEYDMIAMALNTGISGGYIDIYNNVMQMKYINLEHEWWVQDTIEQCSINEQLYFLAGDACLSTYSNIGCILANLTVGENENLGVDLYETVRNGEWTIDEMIRLAKLVGSDLDGDGLQNPGSETYGWCMHNVLVRLMWSSCGIDLIVREPAGNFVLRDSLDQRILDFVEKLKNAFDDPHTNYVSDDDPAIDDFVKDRAYLMSTYLGIAEKLKAHNIDSPFAILPMPKYDMAQEDYISTNFPFHNALFFPGTAEAPALCGMVAEFMGWQGKEIVVPEYYDVSLKYKKSDVTANIEMLDLIRDKLRITPNESYGVISVEGIGAVMGWTQLTTYTASGDRFYATPESFWKKNSAQVAQKINDYVLQYYK